MDAQIRRDLLLKVTFYCAVVCLTLTIFFSYAVLLHPPVERAEQPVG